MQMTLTRHWRTPDIAGKKGAIIGIFRVLEGQKELFRCYSLEENNIGAARNQDLAIPFGKYKLKRHKSPKFNATLAKILGEQGQDMVLLYNDVVPDDRTILIHWGNDESDTLGCILLGEVKSADNRAVYNSRAACKEFYKLIKGVDISEISLEIINALNL